MRSARRHRVYTFSGNFTDGLRHFLQASFVPEKPTLVLIDGEKKFLDADKHLHLADAYEFWFGGSPEIERRDEMPKHNYEGCISSEFFVIFFC
jgi:hypothetical protein